MNKANTKPNIFLDLDQTLISAEPGEEYNFNKNKHKAKLFNYKNMDGYYIVFERPGLQKFLDYIFKNFNVSIWTAATKDYALFIIENIIIGNRPERKLDWIFFSYHCNISSKIKNGTKDLAVIWDVYNIPGYSHKNTVILDDYSEVFNTQPGNCIIAKIFEFTDEGSENDDFLLKLIPKLKKMKKEIANKLSNNPANIINEK